MEQGGMGWIFLDKFANMISESLTFLYLPTVTVESSLPWKIGGHTSPKFLLCPHQQARGRGRKGDRRIWNPTELKTE